MKKTLIISISIICLVVVAVFVISAIGISGLSGEQIANGFDICIDNASKVCEYSYKITRAIYYTDVNEIGLPTEYREQAPSKGYVVYGWGYMFFGSNYFTPVDVYGTFIFDDNQRVVYVDESRVSNSNTRIMEGIDYAADVEANYEPNIWYLHGRGFH